MMIRKIRSEGLAHISYLVGSGGKAVVIDPRRDCEAYVDIADEEGLRIIEILETHRNEDYVTGSRELASMTGARIRHGDLDFGYGELIKDGEEVVLGQAVLKAIATPGHTPESMSYALIDRSSGPEATAVFTGDTLFVGEVGRTDLLGHDRIEELAGNLYDSLHRKLVPLGPEVMIFPAHTAGSVCGGHISTREESTIGIELRQNRMLRMDRDTFMETKSMERIEKPFYFFTMEKINLHGQPVLGSLPRLPPLSSRQFDPMSESHAILDVRDPFAFASAHIKGAISVPMKNLAGYAGWVLRYDLPLLLVLSENDDRHQTVRELIRIGYDRIDGFLFGGMDEWIRSGMPVRAFPVTDPRGLDRLLSKGDVNVLDVRTQKEWESGHIEGAQHIFVGHLYKRLDEVPRDRPVAIMCSSGFRGSVGASILQNEGFDNVMNILGGMDGWANIGLPVTK